MTERLGKMGVAAAVGGPSPPRRHHHPRSGPVTDRYMLDALALDDLIPIKYSHPKTSHNPYHPEPMTSRDDHYHKYHYHREVDALDQPRRRSYVDYDAVEDTKPLHSLQAPEFDMLFQDYISTKQGAAPPRYKPSIPVEEEDVFDLYEAPARDRRPLPPAPTSSSGRRFVPTEESSHLSYEMRSRLEGSQSAPKSMGIFANPTKALPGSSSSSSGNKGYRVLVTNLHSSVTVWDIQELFADIGGLLSADFVKPGVAEVVYKTMKDAEDAVEVYHNRQLDGQPMKCHMITQPPPQAAKVPAYHGGGFGGSGRKEPPLELDLDTLHSALFTKKRH